MRPYPFERAERVVRLADHHPADCRCASCAPYVPADPLDASVADSAHRVSVQIVAGFAVGLLLCGLLDLATGQHGLLLMLGLR